MFFFKKSAADKASDLLAFMVTDIHSHLVPGIDDGVKETDTSLTFIEQLEEMGIRRIITTPHIIMDQYPNSRESITPPFTEVKQLIGEKGSDIQFSFAAEYYMDEQFAELMKSPLLTLHDQLVLVEMSFMQAPMQLHQWLFDLKSRGYEPVLAHPERYLHYHNNYKQYEQLKEWGCLFQVNLLSLTSYYGKHIQKVAERLVEDKLIDVIGTDLHHTRHMQAIQSIGKDKKLRKLLDSYPFRNRELMPVLPSPLNG